MKLTSPQREAFEALKNKIKDVEKSSSKWGIAFIGPDSFGKTEVIKFLVKNVTNEELEFVRLDLFAPVICPEPRVNVNWEEYIKQVKDLLPNINFSEIDEINSILNKMSKINSICKEKGKRVFIVLDHLEICRNWREARWPIENEIADIIAVCDDDAWKKAERVITSFFFKRVYLNELIDFKKDKETFCEIVAGKFELQERTILEFFDKISGEYSKGRTFSWNDILKMLDEMETL
ncbi:MAG: hypothetical protein OEY22_05540 [Candidatus Bathyarchaeota archaeon]|nr:hypothetical protein [Candidatus Bathyarchaeota archaeon]